MLLLPSGEYLQRSHVHAMSVYHRQWTDLSAHNSLHYEYRHFPRQQALSGIWTCTGVCITQYGYVHGHGLTLQSYSTGMKLHKLHSICVLHKWYGFNTQSYSTGMELHKLHSTYVLHKWYGFNTQSYSTGMVLHIHIP